MINVLIIKNMYGIKLLLKLIINIEHNDLYLSLILYPHNIFIIFIYIYIYLF